MYFWGNHINGIENFWGLCKVRLAKFRGLHKHKFYYHIKEGEFRYNFCFLCSASFILYSLFRSFLFKTELVLFLLLDTFFGCFFCFLFFIYLSCLNLSIFYISINYEKIQRQYTPNKTGRC